MTGVLRVVRDVGDEVEVDMSRPEAQQTPLAWVLGAVRAAWPDLDAARQVLIDPVTCTRVKNDARLRQLLARPDAPPTVFLFDVRLLSPHSAVQRPAPPLFRLSAPIPRAPSQRLTAGAGAAVPAFSAAATADGDTFASGATSVRCSAANSARSSSPETMRAPWPVAGSPTR